MLKKGMRIWLLSLFLFLIPVYVVQAETIEEQLNNLTGPIQQYGTYLSPVYLRTNTTGEHINPQSGDLTLTQTDYVLPGRNGLDLEITRIYRSGISNMQEMKVKYVSGAWVDYVEPDESSFYEDRYNLGIGMRFSFPSIEIRENEDETSHKFLHTENGDVYRLRAYTVDGELIYLPDGQTVEDAVVTESDEFSNGQSDGKSKFVLTTKEGKKTYFSEDGRLLGIVDRYGNKITFEYNDLEYKVNGKTITKKLISRITDTVGRVVTIEYKEDHGYKVKPKTNVAYGAEERWKYSQNPNTTDSGDLEGKFQVIIRVPGGKQLVYDKTAALVNNSKEVLRTRMQRVYDVDGEVKYHYWYEQPDLGFTYMNEEKYSVFNRYENLVQIDYIKTNRLKRFQYNTFTKGLNKGSMQYRKIFESADLSKMSFDNMQENFLDMFVANVEQKVTYSYTNEPDGYGIEGYEEYDYLDLKETYRYHTVTTDLLDRKEKYTYNGNHELLETERTGAEHKEVIRTERDEMKLVKKKETLSYNVVNGEPVGEPYSFIENFRYDKYGNLTNYVGPEAMRDADGNPLDDEHMVIYSYAYGNFHILQAKTWKQDADTISQLLFEIDEWGNVTRETRLDSKNPSQSIVTEFEYDEFGNMIKKVVDGTFETRYLYDKDVEGTDVKGAYLTQQVRVVNHDLILTNSYAYDFDSGNRTVEIDPNGNRTTYEYDILNRVTKTIYPDGSIETIDFIENDFGNMQVIHQDQEGFRFSYTYNIFGQMLENQVQEADIWNVLDKVEYDAAGNKVKETDSNGHSVQYTYDSLDRPVELAFFDRDGVNRAKQTIAYTYGGDNDTALLVKMTDEEGYIQYYHYDVNNRFIKHVVSPDHESWFTTSYTYDYVGNKLSETDALQNTTYYRYDSSNRLIESENVLDELTTYVYNGLNKVVKKIEPGNKVTEHDYDAGGRLIHTRTYLEGTGSKFFKRYSYDSADNVTAVEIGSIHNDSEQISAQVTYFYDEMNRISDEYQRMDESRQGHLHYEYDNRGNKRKEIHYIDANKKSYREYIYDYNFAGQVLGVTGAFKENGGQNVQSSFSETYIRDYAGNLIAKKVWNGTQEEVTSYTYDHRNRLIKKEEPYNKDGTMVVTEYEYDKTGNVLAEVLMVMGLAVRTTYTYDGLGRRTAITDSLGNTTRYVYDANGNLVKTVDARFMDQALEQAPGTIIEYDGLNRPVRTIAFDGTTSLVIEYKEYDGRYNIILEADAEGYNRYAPDQSIGVQYTYDANDNRVTIISAQMLADNRETGHQRVTWRYTYDALGKKLTEEDTSGNITRYTYYLNGLLKEVNYPDDTLVTYDYDLTGKHLIIENDRAGYATAKYHNIFDQPYLVQHPDGTEETYRYSNKGLLVSATDRSGNIKRYEYDLAGNRTSIHEYVGTDGDYQIYKVTEQLYDEARRIIKSETFSVRSTRSGELVSKDSMGDRTEQIYDRAGRLIETIGSGERRKVMSYDSVGNMVKLLEYVDLDEFVVSRYTYDFRSRLTSESLLVGSSDIKNELLANAQFDQEYLDQVLATTQYSYYGNGSLKSMTDPNGHKTVFEYDYNGQIIKETAPLFNVTEYQYDERGNLIKQVDASGYVTSYAYDALNRLISESTPATDGGIATTRYVYDSRGNLVKLIAPNEYDPLKDNPLELHDMAGTTYTYDSMNRQVSTFSPDGELIEMIAYDANGNITKIVDGLRYTGEMASSKGTVYRYDGLNRAIEVTDALNNRTKYAYDVLDRVTEMIDANGYSTKYKYNPDGMLALIVYSDGAEIKYNYDKLGRTTEEVDPLGNITRYHYNAFGEVAEITDPYGMTVENKYDLSGNLVSQKDKRGSVSLYFYDAANRPIEKHIPQRFDASGNVIYAIETYEYDKIGNITRHTLRDSKDESFIRIETYTYYTNHQLYTESDSNGGYTEYHYDKNGNVVEREQRREANDMDVVRYRYDSSNRLVQEIELIEEELLSDLENYEHLRDEEYPDHIQRITGYIYDRLGNQLQVIDPRAYVMDESGDPLEEYIVKYTYDELNRLVRITRKYQGSDIYSAYSYDGVGNTIAVRNERGDVTTYDYDSRNRVTKMTDPEGFSMTYTYDMAGNKVSETNANGSTMKYKYDKLNRLSETIDPLGISIEMRIYDANDNMIKKMDAKGIHSADTDAERYGWIYTYDLANRLVSVLDPVFADEQDFTEKYTYNPAGEKTSITDALGNIMRYEYDQAGNLIGVQDKSGVLTQYLYDKTGNKVYMIDGRGKVTHYSYGSFGLLKAVTDADNQTTTYLYDLASNRTDMIDRMGYHTRYIYDNRDQLLETSVDETQDKITFTYDAVGNRVQMIDESGTSVYSYDKNRKLVEIQKNGLTQLVYTYDGVGNITSVTDASGYTVYYTYDQTDRMESVVFDGKSTSYVYDLNGNREKVIYPGGVVEAYTYDKSDRLLTIVNTRPDGTVLSSYSYTYDAIGRKITMKDSYGTTDYTYDSAGRVQKVEAPGKTTVYAFDKVGNRLSQQEIYTSLQPSGYIDLGSGEELKYAVKKSEYLYNNLNQLLNLTEYMYDAEHVEMLKKTTTYLYDANGNEIRQKVSYLHPHNASMRQVTGGEAYGDSVESDSLNNLIERVGSTYDGFNRLKTMEKVKAGNRSTVSFVYDGDGLRIEKRVASSTNNYEAEITRYLYDREYVLLESAGSGDLHTRYVRGVNYVARMDGNNGLSYFLYNGHGDVVQTVSDVGEIENQYEYDIFGNPVLTLETEYRNAIRYAGEYYDEESGLYYLRARYYNPYIGRFTSEDSYIGDFGEPHTLHRYTYVHNDPINFYDPSGRWEQGDEDLNVEAKAKIIALTSAYHKASTKEEKDAIHKQANAIRDNPKSWDKTVVTPLKFSTNEIERVIDRGVSKRGYATADEWEKALKDSTIKTTTSTTRYISSKGPEVSTNTTTIIDRTNISVNSHAQLVEKKGSASMEISYNINQYEAVFLRNLAEDYEKEGVLESTLVALEYMHRNDGKITKEQLEEVGFASSTVKGYETAYYFSFVLGTSFANAEILYQQEVVSQNRAQAWGLVGLRSVGGRNAIASARTTKPVSVELSKVSVPSAKLSTTQKVDLKTNARTGNPSTSAAKGNQPVAGGNVGSNLRHPGTGNTFVNGNKYWNRTTEFKGVKVYQRNDIIDPNKTDAMGRTNLQRMEQGLAPVGPDGKSVNLHHMTQRNDSSIAEVTQTFHQENSKVLHINPNTVPSGINRNEFNKWKSDYWKSRAGEFK